MKPMPTNVSIRDVLQQYTTARVALGKTGTAQFTKDILSFRAAHAQAKDSIYQTFDSKIIADSLTQLNRKVWVLKSKANDKREFLLRPDLGRQLHEESMELISKVQVSLPFDLCISISDGLSVSAIDEHCIPLMTLLLKKMDEAGYSIAPICIIERGRVAISDMTGFLTRSRVSLILIGERPGLSASNSLGAYITYGPKAGNTDANRNCISNIHQGGLHYESAADEILSLVTLALQKQMSGTQLKTSVTIPSHQ